MKDSERTRRPPVISGLIEQSLVSLDLKHNKAAATSIQTLSQTLCLGIVPSHRHARARAHPAAQSGTLETPRRRN